MQVILSYIGHQFLLNFSVFAIWQRTMENQFFFDIDDLVFDTLYTDQLELY